MFAALMTDSAAQETETFTFLNQVVSSFLTIKLLNIHNNPINLLRPLPANRIHYAGLAGGVLMLNTKRPNINPSGSNPVQCYSQTSFLIKI